MSRGTLHLAAIVCQAPLVKPRDQPFLVVAPAGEVPGGRRRVVPAGVLLQRFAREEPDEPAGARCRGGGRGQCLPGIGPVGRPIEGLRLTADHGHRHRVERGRALERVPMGSRGPGGAKSMLYYDLAAGSTSQEERDKARTWLVTYNRNDVEATAALRGWMRDAGSECPWVSELRFGGVGSKRSPRAPSTTTTSPVPGCERRGRAGPSGGRP